MKNEDVSEHFGKKLKTAARIYGNPIKVLIIRKSQLCVLSHKNWREMVVLIILQGWQVYIYVGFHLGTLHGYFYVTVSDKIKWDTLPSCREKTVSSPFSLFQCCSCVVKNFTVTYMSIYNIDLGDGGRGKVALPNWQSFVS